MAGNPGGERSFAVVAWPAPARLAAAALMAVSRGSLVAALLLLMFTDHGPTNPFKQLRYFLWLCAAPGLAAWCIARAYAATATAGAGVLRLETKGETIELPLASVAAVEPWPLPAPGPGLRLRLASGRYLQRSVQVPGLGAFVDALVAAGASPSLRDGLRGLVGTFEAARAACPPGWLENPVLKFAVYSLVPTVPAFRLHQFITFGGALGEYYTYGLKAYLTGFGIWWMSWGFHVLVVAAGVRVLVEALALAAAAGGPSVAVPARRWLEVAQRLFYYVGIPGFLILRFTA